MIDLYIAKHIHIYVYRSRNGRDEEMNELVYNYTGAVKPQQTLSLDLFNSFIDYLDTTEKTVRTYKTSLGQFFKYLAAENINKPTREDVIAYRESLKETGHKPTTVQSYITAVKLFFTWTSLNGLYPNIADHVKGAKISHEHKKDYLTEEQVKNVLAGIDRSTTQGARDYAMIALMVTGGLRDIEVSRANIEDLQTAAKNRVLYIQGKGKDEKADYIILSEDAEEAITEYLKTREGADLAEPLFVSLSNNSTGARLSTRSISGTVKARMKAAGYDSDRLTAHSLRHTAITLSLKAGMKLDEVQEFARHANINTTMIYNHSLRKENNGCSRAVSSMIFG